MFKKIGREVPSPLQGEGQGGVERGLGKKRDTSTSP